MSEPNKSIALLIERLVAISQAGLAYSTDSHDRERFAQLETLSAELLASLSGEGPSLAGLFSEDTGYRTPKVDVRAVVFRDDAILLVREKINGRWTVPGGWADIGQSPAECAARELKEESGYDGRIVRLLALFDGARHNHDPCPWHSYKAFFLCEVDGRPAENTLETDGVGFFPIDALPELSTGRVTERQIRAFYDCVNNGNQTALFD